MAVNTAVAVALLTLLLLQMLLPTGTAAQSNNNLFTEGFEGKFTADPYCTTGICNVPEGWGVWFIPRRDTDQPGINFQPQYTQINTPNRVKSGSAAQRVATENATFTGGIFRIVNNVKIGAKLKLTAWGQSWSTNDESPISARPSMDIKLKIGIDPMGGSNGQASPLNGQVVWSAEHDAKDVYTQFSVETVAKSQTVIVYLYATMKDPVRHNEVYWDNVSLDYTAPPPTPTLTPAAAAANTTPTTTPTPTPLPPTVQPPNGVTYTVKAGDTLYDIAVKFNKSVEGIKRMNSLSSDMLSIGQVLIIEPAPIATPAVTIQPTAVLSATATPGTGALCVQAYFDTNGNGQRDASEGLVPNVLINVTAKGAAIASYTTDGKSEPYCIRNVAAGAYTVAATTSSAYVATTPLNDTVSVPGGAAAEFAVGLRRASDGNQVVGATGTPPATQSTSNSPSVLAIIATIGGALLILVTIGFGVLFFMQNWKM